MILSKGLDGLDDECRKKIFYKFTKQQKTFCLSLHYNGVNSYIFIDGVEIHKFKVKNLK